MKTSTYLHSTIVGLASLAMSASLHAATVTFQEGVNGYTGTQDTQVRGATPTRNDGAVTSLSVDRSDGGGENHILIRFDNIVGTGANQIPKGSVIVAATLTLRITDLGSANTTMNRMLAPWTESSTWESMGDGITADDAEAATTEDVKFSVAGTVPYLQVIKLRPETIQEWLDGTKPNHGWAILPGGTDGVDFDSSENGTAANRPLLKVVYGLPGQPVLKTFIPTPIGFLAQIEDSTPPTGIVAQDSIGVTFDGAKITPQIAKAGTTTTLSYVAPAALAVSSSHTATFTFTDSSTPPKAQTDPNTFVVAAYTAIPAEFAVPGVDTSKPGFKVRVLQTPHGRFPGNRGLNANAERALALGYIDTTTGKPYPNTADVSSYGPDGFAVESGVINYNEAAPTDAGNFSSSSTPAFPDKAFPGIPGSGAASTDYYVTEVHTVLELKRGPYRLGVSSDDGAKVMAVRNPGDVVGQILGQKNGTGGTSDTIFDFVIPADGFYPFRLTHNEHTGGSTFEFFAVDLISGAKTLINDLNATSPIRAYRESTASRPYISRALPPENYLFAFADDDLTIDIADGTAPVNTSSINLTLNGAAVNVTPTKSGKLTTLARKGSLSSLLPSGANSVRLIYSFTEAGTTVTVTNTWAYSVPAYTVPIPSANKVARGSVTGSGFKIVRSHQIDRSLDASQGNGGRYTGQGGGGNNMPRPEIQLSDGYINRTNNAPYPNLAQAGPNADGSWDVDLLNYNSATGGNSGIFQGSTDTAVPGLPGTGSSNGGADNFVQEIFTYLDLKAGAYVFGLNVDDGFIASSSPNPRDTLGTLLGFKPSPGGNSGTLVSAAAFNVVVPEDGVYPFRVLWWQGGGGVNIEFLTVDRNTGIEVLVNDGARQVQPPQGAAEIPGTVIPTFNNYSGPVRPWTKFSVYPMPNSSTLWQNTIQQSGPGPIRIKVGAGNPADIANDAPAIRPFGDAVGAVVADVGSGSIGMVVDGTTVTPALTDVPGSSDKLVLYRPTSPFASGSTHTAGLIYAGATNYWTFTVITNVTVPAGVALPSSAADQSARGFKVKVVQAITSTTLANTVARAEAQLAGNPANVALAGPNADGTYTIPGIINWNNAKNPGNTTGEIGNFQPLLGGPPDDPIPGIPGTGLTSGAARFENIAAEIFAYLDLPAGYQKFGINGDDGWKVQIGAPGKTDEAILFTVDRGAGARDIPFAFITPQAGLYPLRIVWYQGGGGANLEFFTYGADNTKIPVNDAKNANSIKAYHNVTGGPVEAPKFTGIKVNANGSLTIEWIGGGTLEAAPSVTGPWAAVTGATSPFTFTPTLTAQFGRIKR